LRENSSKTVQLQDFKDNFWIASNPIDIPLNIPSVELSSNNSYGRR